MPIISEADSPINYINQSENTGKLTVVEELRGEQWIFKIVDQDGSMVAKANGRQNKGLCERLAHSYNETYLRGINPAQITEMRHLLLNRLISILKSINYKGMAVLSFKPQNDPEEIIKALKSRMEDDKEVIEKLIGKEAVQILKVL